ncbi:MAG: hypothetical protein BalsKO_29610 [Balneolaceae bacterium]
MKTRIYLTTLLLTFCICEASFAQTAIKLDSLITDSGNFAIGGLPDSDFGLELTSGDFNGDQIQDIVVTSSDNAPGTDNDTRNVSIIFGSDSLTGTNRTTILIGFGSSTDPSTYEFGREVGSGDLNNDGIDDLIVGMPEYNNNDGRVYVLYGQQNWAQTNINLATIDSSQGFRLDGGSGSNSGSRLGDGYAIGDFDNDNLNDLFVSAPFTNTSFDQYKGKGYVVFGKAIKNKLTLDLDTLSQKSGVVIYTSNVQDGVGNEASFVDLNGDGIDDLLMAAENAWSQGRIYTLYGNSTHPDSVNISSISRGVNGMTIFGSFSPTLTRFGKDFDTGDFNGDGELDFIASASRTGGVEGSIYIVFGGTGVFDDNVYPTVLQPDKGLIINGEIGNFLGIYLDVADLNNDGFDDIVFTGGIHDLDPNITQYYENKLRILLGTDSDLPDILDLDTPAPDFDLFEIKTDIFQRDLGYSVTAIDINNDSNTDLIFGSKSENQNTGEELFGVNFILNFTLSTTGIDTVIADTADSDTAFFAGGSGTAEDPYLVATAEQLDSVRFFPDKSFLQTNDIDLISNQETGWIPIGYQRDDTYLLGDREPFSGTYDGGGFSIRNLYIENRGKNAGFIYSLTGTVKNLTINQTAVTYLAPEELPDSIKNIPNVDLTEDIPRFAGIVAGRVEATGSVENVTVLSGILEFGSVGFITGWNEGSITRSYATGTVQYANQAGGITAVNLGSITISAYEGSLLNIENATGGIAGTNIEGSISESYTNVAIRKTGVFGGIAGVYQYGTLENNYVQFDVRDSSSIGGIIGLYGIGGSLSSSDNPINITYNYAFGEIDSKTEFENFYKGIIGQGFLSSQDSAFTSTKVRDNYWNNEVFGSEDSLFGFRIKTGGRSTQEMKQVATFEGWDFSVVWEIDENSTFPYLKNNPPIHKPGENLVSTSTSQIIELPNTVTLSQNYPNPFNPSTSISYALTNSSIVTLEVFNLLGQKVRTLVNGKAQKAGNYSVQFDAQGLSSGVYIYQLRLKEGFALTKRLTIIK